ncbi:hypothetical protein D3C72_1093860 [compost metagenome]
MATRPEQRQSAHAGQAGGQMRGRQPTEREADQIDIAHAGQLGEACCHGFHQRRQVSPHRVARGAVAGQIRHPDRMACRQRLDIAHPVQPAAVAAVHQQHVRPAAKAAPHHAAPGRFRDAGRALRRQSCDECRRRCVFLQGPASPITTTPSAARTPCPAGSTKTGLISASTSRAPMAAAIAENATIASASASTSALGRPR